MIFGNARVFKDIQSFASYYFGSANRITGLRYFLEVESFDYRQNQDFQNYSTKMILIFFFP